nr:MAG TPA: hypothetical protein [Bacteriophage sp.]
MMKVKDAIARLKSATHDISDEYSTDACLEFINTAIQQVASLLIAAKWPVLAKETIIRDGDKLPHNYMGACGTYPIRMTNNVATITDGSDSVRFRYFATPDLVGEDDDFPFDHEAINAVILRSAILLALNENEYDVTQDSSIISTLEQAISAGMS